MSGADFRQQQELEEMEQELSSNAIDPCDFVAGQIAARKSFVLTGDETESFLRGYEAEIEIGEQEWM